MIHAGVRSNRAKLTGLFVNLKVGSLLTQDPMGMVSAEDLPANRYHDEGTKC